MAGEWARVKGTVLGLWPLFGTVFVAGAAVVTCGFLSLLWGAVLLVASLIAAIICLMRGLRRVESFFKGARGEERVAGILASLPPPYHVFNDFVAGRKHVDHVVVGPTGVFAVETKSWRGRVTIEEGCLLVDGELPDRAPLAQAAREASQVQAALQARGWSGAVTPVLAFSTDTFGARRANVRGVIVMNSSELRESFSSDRVVIPPAELERLVGLMEARA